MSTTAPETGKVSLTTWLVLTVAAIGFLFDTYELLMTPLVLAPALSDLLNLPANHPEVTAWVGRVLWMTALCGGVFGLLGGYLIDQFGRKTVMVASIFLYSFSPVMAGLSTDLGWLIFFRCTTFVGVCVEFVAAVTWLAELFPDKKMKELALGWTQAFASVGGLLVTAVSAGVGYMAVNKMLPAIPGIETRATGVIHL
jgi:MFS family permease